MARTEMTDADRDEVGRFIERHWFSRAVVSHGEVHYPHREQAFIERRAGEIVGLLTFRVDDSGMELLTINCTIEGEGIGTQLMLSVIDKARREGCRRIWVTTTNDNLRVVGFNQRLGFRIVGVRLGAIDEARKIKPEIPHTGERGVPIQDEIVMELQLQPYID